MRKRSVSILALVIAVAITAWLFALFLITTKTDSYFQGSVISPTYDDTAFGGVFASNEMPINDSLPHYLYRHLADSIKKINEVRQLENRGVGLTGMAFGSLGLYSMGTSDTLHYLSLQGYSLDYETKFFIQNGNYNLAVLKVDSTKGPKDNLFQYGHYERKQIPVRYSENNKMVLIPVSQKQFRVLNILIPGLGYSLMFVSFYFFIGLPLRILVSISKGDAFNDKNIRRFNGMALVLLILGMGSVLFPYAMRFCFRIPDNFTLPGFWPAVWDMSGLFIVALGIFITGKAFAKGNRLQKEQDLTI